MTEQKVALKYLLIALAIVVALLITVVVIISVNPKDVPDSDNDSSISLINYDSAKIISARVHTNSDDYGIIVKNGVVQIQELGNVKANITALNQFIMDIASVTADSEVTNNPADLALYGLDNPQYVEVTLNDQTTYRINIGSTAPLGGTYVSMEGEDTVYIIDSGVDNIIKQKEEYVNLDLIGNSNITDNDGDIIIVKPSDITLGGTIRGNGYISVVEEQYYGLDNKIYVLPDYYSAPVDEVLMSDILSKLAPFSASAAVEIIDNNTDMSKYGLDKLPDNQRSNISFNIGETVHKITLGDKNNGEYYALIDDIECVFTVNEEYVPWAELLISDLVSSAFLDPGITKIEKIVFDSIDFSYTFDIKSELYGSDYAISRVLLNGKEFDINKYKEIYDAFIQSTMLDDSKLFDKIKTDEWLKVTVYYDNTKVTAALDHAAITFNKLTDGDDYYIIGYDKMLTVDQEAIYHLLKLLDEIN